LYTHVRTALFKIAKGRCNSNVLYRSINKQTGIYTLECYSALKTKETLTYATTGMNLEDMLTERARHKLCLYLILFYAVPTVVKLLETESSF
jgi:hypothetical protein